MKPSRRSGFTLVEIMIVVAMIALLAAIAIPNVLRGRVSANEAAAIGNLRSLTSGLEMYRSVFASYPDAWQADMYTTPTPDYGPASFNLLMAGGAASQVQGYQWTYTPTGAEPNVSVFTITAVPATVPSTGTRGFFADETGVLRHCSCAAAGACNTPAIGNNSIDQPPAAC